MTEFNSAMSYILKNALIGKYPDFAIDYENALVSRGSLSGILNGSAVSTEANYIVFTWDDNSDEGSAKSTDKAMLLVYNESKGETVFETEGDARNAGTQTLTIPTDFSGDSVECYISFISEDGLSVTNSKYVGSVSVV